MYKRLLSGIFPCNHSAFLFGPRQTGKTTLLKEFESLLYIDLLDTKLLLEYNKQPGLLYNTVASFEKKSGYVIIDEVQKVPTLLDEVQRCIDQFPNIYFILSGSSARKLKRGFGNLLGGRALYFPIYPLTAQELSDSFSIDNCIKFGSLPHISKVLADGKELLAIRLLKSYIATYISEEIKAEALVRNLESFQRFLEVVAHQFAQDINISALADQALISSQSVKSYYSILEDTMIGFFLHPWATSLRKQLTKTSKFYFFDNGVVRALQSTLSAPPTNQEKGHLFEQWIVQEVVRLNAYLEKDLKINFWRTTGGAEVDIVISRNKKIILAIECKATPYPGLRDLSSLKAFAEEYPKIPSFICAPVDRRRVIQDKYQAVPPDELFDVISKL